jgi:penicillin-binding protein 2
MLGRLKAPLMILRDKSTIDSNKSTLTVGQNFRGIHCIVLSLLVLGGVVSRLAYLQLSEGERFEKIAQSNRVRVIPTPPERGNIFDRNGKILATTSAARSVYLWPMSHKKPSWEAVVPRLEKILGISKAEIEEKLDEAGSNSGSLVRIASDINMAQVTAIKEYEDELPKVEIHNEGVRTYPFGEKYAHLMGYTRQLNGYQLREKRREGYRLGDVIGQMGAEKAFERTLRGKWGGKRIEVDARGRMVQPLGEIEAESGDDINLTLDVELQKAAQKALEGRRGAIVAMNPNNGAILAMASYPTFDPNIFSKEKLSKKEWESLQQKQNPLVNRALSAFPPASTFKIVTTAAGLESGKFSPTTVLPTYGSLKFGGTRFGEWNHAGFGPLGWRGAMAMSSDTFFYQVAARTGGEALIDWTRRFGFGEKSGFEFATEEAKGLVPDTGYKLVSMNREWTVGDSVNMSIGQGALLATPLQVAMMFAVPANGGYRVQPHLLKDNEEAKNWRESVGMSPVTLKIIRDGLREVITRGTGKGLNTPSVPIAGKTGTAEAWLTNGVKQNHTWFGAYAPFDKPEIVVVTFAEHSDGSGGKVAGPITLEVIEKYFQMKRKK